MIGLKAKCLENKKPLKHTLYSGYKSKANCKKVCVTKKGTSLSHNNNDVDHDNHSHDSDTCDTDACNINTCSTGTCDTNSCDTNTCDKECINGYDEICTDDEVKEIKETKKDKLSITKKGLQISNIKKDKTRIINVQKASN